MTPPTVQFIPAAAAADTLIIRFDSAVTSPSNEFNVDHINLSGNSIMDGRGLTNSIDILGTRNPDQFQMHFPSGTDRDSGLSYLGTFSSLHISDDTDSVEYVVTAASSSTQDILFTFGTGENAVWVTGNQYTLIGR